jgi:cell wall-associated NlpC family hydrolase
MMDAPGYWKAQMTTLIHRALICGLIALVPVLAGCGAAAETSPRVEVKAAHKAELPPLPKSHPKLVEPVAGQAESPADEIATSGAAAPETAAPKPTGPASGTLERHDAPSAINGGTKNATALDNGVALPPLEAPTEVLKIIEAGNAIARTPYKWGGGHGRFLDTGYDCSGSVSFALYAAGLIEGPRDSGGLMSWGKAGPGKWVTIFSSPGHVYMEVAGIRFDTSGAQATGSRWQNDLRGRRAGFVARHPPGL